LVSFDDFLRRLWEGRRGEGRNHVKGALYTYLGFIAQKAAALSIVWLLEVSW
jgi:hypothetical protein